MVRAALLGFTIVFCWCNCSKAEHSVGGSDPFKFTFQVFMTKDDIYVQNKRREFFFFLPQDKQEDLKKTILEGIETGKHQVRLAFDACKLQPQDTQPQDTC